MMMLYVALLLSLNFCLSISQSESSSLNARLLSTLEQFPASKIASPTQSSKFLRITNKWLFIGIGSLCGVLVIVLVAQFIVESEKWRQRKQILAEDEACRRHIAVYAAGDIENQDTSSVKQIPEGVSSALPVPPQQPSTTSISNFSTGGGVCLPAKLIMKRAPSLRPERTSIRRSGSSSSSSTPRSPLGRAPLRRSSSSRFISRSSSSSSSSPRTFASSELSVDASVKAQDVTAFGWVANPHSRRNSSGSTLNSPMAAAAAAAVAATGSSRTTNTTISYTLTPGKLNYRLGEETTGGGDDRLPPPPKPLMRMGTDAGVLMDFKLTTSVAEDATQEKEEEEESQRRTSSSENGGRLTTAQSIKPKDIIAGMEREEEEEVSGIPKQDGDLKVAPGSQQQTSETQSPRSLLLAQAHVALLTAEQFLEEVQLIRLLGAGGAGVVHQGQWRGRSVAVKVLHPSRQTSLSAEAAFRREVEIMARIGPHPGVISLLAACFTPPTMAIVVELAERGSLHSVLHDEGLRPRYGTLLAIAEDVAAAVAHCHSLKLVHRDLKTHNVLLTADGVAKVADFGLAAAKNRTFLTVEPGALGTAAYMSPEQFSATFVSERCDSYAFGCMLWEMITGRQPWQECSNIMQIVMAVGCERRRPALPKGCPPRLSRLIRECWRHNAALRPGFTEIVATLRQIRDEDGVIGAFKSVSRGAAKGEFGGVSEALPPNSQFSLAHYLVDRHGGTTTTTGKHSPSLSRLAISSS